MPLSVAIVCKNNQATIGRVLDSAGLLLTSIRTDTAPDAAGGIRGEIIAVDSGSTDSTLTMLENAGARIVHTPWLGHVRTKQLALDEASKGLGPNGWVLCLDSDEPPDERLRGEIARVVSADDPAVSGYRVNRKIWYRGRFLEHAWQPEWRLRLVRPGRAVWTGADPHDRMEATDGGRVDDLAGTLRHDSFETFVEHLGKQVGHARVSAASLVAAGERSSYWRLATSPLGAFFKQVVLKGAWRDGYAGWLAAGSTAAGAIMKHMAMIELQRATKGPTP